MTRTYVSDYIRQLSVELTVRSFSQDILFYNVSLSIYLRIMRYSCPYMLKNHIICKYKFIASRMSRHTISFEMRGYNNLSRDESIDTAPAMKSCIINRSIRGAKS